MEYPNIHLYFLENINDFWDIPMYTMRKGCITILIGSIFYGQGMKQINSCLIERYKLSHNYYFSYSSWEWFFFPDILKEVPPQVLSGMLIY